MPSHNSCARPWGFLVWLGILPGHQGCCAVGRVGSHDPRSEQTSLVSARKVVPPKGKLCCAQPRPLGGCPLLTPASSLGPTAHSFLNKPYSTCSLWVHHSPQNTGWGDLKSPPYQTKEKPDHLWGVIQC